MGGCIRRTLLIRWRRRWHDVYDRPGGSRPLEKAKKGDRPLCPLQKGGGGLGDLWVGDRVVSPLVRLFQAALNMFYSIRHLTQFRYDSPVSESLMEMRMHPRTEGAQRCLSFQVSIDPRTQTNNYRDYLGNIIHHFDVPEK